MVEFFGGPNRLQDEPPYYLDIITFSANPYNVDLAKIKHHYLNYGLSATQIADKLGVSKATIIDRLHSLNIRPGKGNGRFSNPKNFRAPVSPYGYQVIDGALTPNRKELKVCRLVVQLINQKGFSYTRTGKELVARNIKNRKGKASWGASVIQSIYKRWSGKV